MLIAQEFGLVACLTENIAGLAEYDALLIEQILRVASQAAQFTAALA
ncbi:hypothetical protein GCM10009805_11040 [Leucobacter chromiireducens subsp. solipictus]